MFARYWVEAFRDPTVDRDKNDSITAMEAFEYADRKTTGFYDSEKRLATEHPVFEDTGKGQPVRAAAPGFRRRALSLELHVAANRRRAARSE